MSKNDGFYFDIIQNGIDRLNHKKLERRLRKGLKEALEDIERLNESRKVTAEDLRREFTI